MIRFLFSVLLKNIPYGEFVGLFCWVVIESDPLRGIYRVVLLGCY